MNVLQFKAGGKEVEPGAAAPGKSFCTKKILENVFIYILRKF
jgi:hypothetical protein